MQTIQVRAGQTLLDISVQYLGDVLRIGEVCDMNGYEITDDLTSGQILNLPDADVSKSQIVAAFIPNLFPASAINDNGNVGPKLEGINYWAIGVDFIVQ